MLPSRLPVPDPEHCPAAVQAPASVAGWAHESMSPPQSVNQPKGLLLLSIIRGPQRGVEDVGRSPLFSVGPMPRRHRWSEHLWWVEGFFKVKDRGLTGIVKEKLIILPEIEKLESKLRQKMEAKQCPYDLPKTKCDWLLPLLSEYQSSLLSCPQILPNPYVNEATSREGKVLNAVRVLTFSRGITVFHRSDNKSPGES